MFFSSKELHKKRRADMHEMLHQKGKNWVTDVSDHFRNGSFIQKDNRVIGTVQANYAEISALIDTLVYKKDRTLPSNLDDLLNLCRTWKLTPEEYAKLDK